MTIKLFYQDAYMTAFEASVVETGTEASGVPYAVLDQTAFYPTGGGQPCDLGTISGIRVVDVEEMNGRIVHRLEHAFPAGRTQVTGEIDWLRRFDHMQNHTGQHLLSAAFEELYDAETFGFHMGKEVITVDIAKYPIAVEEMATVEQLVNRIINENRLVTARFIEPEELKLLPLRKPPKVTENIRIVTVDNFDYSPCGGTHPAHTGEIGSVKVMSWEKYKTGTRVEFVCGNRALAAFDRKQQILRELGRLFGTGENDLTVSAAKILADRKELERSVNELKQSLLEYESQKLKESVRLVKHLRVSVESLENRTMQELQRLAALLTSNANRAALLASAGEKTNLVFAKSEDVEVSMVDLLKAVLPMIDGKGGGNTSIAQGGGNATGDPRYLLEEALRLLSERL